MSWLLDFEYLNVFFGKLKFKKMPKFETLSALRGLIFLPNISDAENGRRDNLLKISIISKGAILHQHSTSYILYLHHPSMNNTIMDKSHIETRSAASNSSLSIYDNVSERGEFI